MSYYIGDIKTQKALLRKQVTYHKDPMTGDARPDFDINVSIARMKKRVAKHFGLLNKYSPKGRK